MLLVSGGTVDDGEALFSRIADEVRLKIGPALNGNEILLFRALPVRDEADFRLELERTGEILSHSRRGLFRHLRMASSFGETRLGDSGRYRIRIDVFCLDHFANIELFDFVFDLIAAELPNTAELLAIYNPFEEGERYGGFEPEHGELYTLLEPRDEPGMGALILRRGGIGGERERR